MHSTTFNYRVEGAIEFGLDSPVEKSDEENDETAPDQKTLLSWKTKTP